MPPASTGALVCILCVALVAAPVASAQWRTSQDAEICITGTGVRSLDIAVCGRALRRPHTLSVRGERLKRTRARL